MLFVIGRWQDALFGFAAIGNALIGSLQEFRAKAALDKLALLNASTARVPRDGAEAEIPPGDVVLGDVLVLRAGDQLPADAQVVGADAYANAFAGEAKRFSLVGSELRDSINRVLGWVGWAIGPVGLLVLNAQMQVLGGWRQACRTGAWVDAPTATIASVTAMIPHGLALMTSIAFAVGAARLASRQVLVDELPAVEGLARVDVICLDKTGTLTEGDIVYGDAFVLAQAPGWQRTLGWYGTAPDANATARTLAAPFGDEPPRRAALTIPFSSARKWSAVSFDDAPGTWVLGAPEMVFGARAGDEADPLGAAVIERASSGRRTLVLGFSAHSLTEQSADAEELPAGLLAVAVLTFREKVRGDAAQTLEYFREQGVGIRIISGDNPGEGCTPGEGGAGARAARQSVQARPARRLVIRSISADWVARIDSATCSARGSLPRSRRASAIGTAPSWWRIISRRNVQSAAVPDSARSWARSAALAIPIWVMSSASDAGADPPPCS